MPNTFGSSVKELVTFWKNTTDSISVAPKRLVSYVYEKSGGLFYTGEPLDIGELWVWALDRLHEDSAEDWKVDFDQLKMPESQKRVLQIAHKYQRGKRSEIIGTFQGMQFTMIKCTACGHVPLNIEPFTTVQLEIPQTDKNLVLSDLFGHMFKKEQVTEWSCDKCKKKEAVKGTRFWSTPSVFVINLKRFMMTPHGIRKNYTNIDIPEQITFHTGSILSEEDDVTYQLRSVGLHHGTYEGGHYTAAVKHNGRWYHCDDDEICEVHNIGHITHQNRTSYMVVYEREDFS
jgi:ubiquitin C-terminal hydrolase